ncbi:hypothetical protein [Bacillus infantis]|uniref:hypothetical protein n=1 Tax=Bacillus infantis TaxID=324767 RepID=UPI0013EADF42|nr:hypothetical protein [Bacillus infantis]
MWKKSLRNFFIFALIGINLVMWPYLLKETGIIKDMPFTGGSSASGSEESGDKDRDITASPETEEKAAEQDPAETDKQKNDSGSASDVFEVTDIK